MTISFSFIPDLSYFSSRIKRDGCKRELPSNFLRYILLLIEYDLYTVDNCFSLMSTMNSRERAERKKKLIATHKAEVD